MIFAGLSFFYRFFPLLRVILGIVRQNLILKFITCVIIDVIGMITFALPGVGELGDAVWAPISAMCLYQLFGSITTAGAGFVEEILPGTDMIPTATIACFKEANRKKNERTMNGGASTSDKIAASPVSSAGAWKDMLVESGMDLINNGVEWGATVYDEVQKVMGKEVQRTRTSSEESSQKQTGTRRRTNNHRGQYTTGRVEEIPDDE